MVETFLNIKPYPSIIRVEMTKTAAQPKLPKFVQVLREVTGEKEYETWFMANSDYMMPEPDRNAIERGIRENKRDAVRKAEAEISKTPPVEIE